MNVLSKNLFEQSFEKFSRRQGGPPRSEFRLAGLIAVVDEKRDFCLRTAFCPVSEVLQRGIMANVEDTVDSTLIMFQILVDQEEIGYVVLGGIIGLFSADPGEVLPFRRDRLAFEISRWP